MRVVDGVKVEFCELDAYFGQTLQGIARRTGADMVLLLAEGKTEADISDDDHIRKLLDTDFVDEKE